MCVGRIGELALIVFFINGGSATKKLTAEPPLKKTMKAKTILNTECRRLCQVQRYFLWVTCAVENLIIFILCVDLNLFLLGREARPPAKNRFRKCEGKK